MVFTRKDFLVFRTSRSDPRTDWPSPSKSSSGSCRLIRNDRSFLCQHKGSFCVEAQVSAQAPETFTECRELVDRCVNETRTLSYLLHPPLLDEVGFASAAKSYVEEFARRSGIETDFSLDLPYRLPAATEILLFRVLQESLTNIHRHSGSSHAKVWAGIDGESVCLEIRDYGRGISQEVLEDFRASGGGVGVGLAGIRERLREVDGKLELSSSGDGTILRVSLLATNTREAHRISAAGVR